MYNQREYFTIKFAVDRDELPGTFHDTDSWENYIRNNLMRGIRHYFPTVRVKHDESKTIERKYEQDGIKSFSFVIIPDCPSCFGSGIFPDMTDAPSQECYACKGSGHDDNARCPQCYGMTYLDDGAGKEIMCPSCQGEGVVA